jgi:hypothetical protein
MQYNKDDPRWMFQSNAMTNENITVSLILHFSSICCSCGSCFARVVGACQIHEEIEMLQRCAHSGPNWNTLCPLVEEGVNLWIDTMPNQLRVLFEPRSNYAVAGPISEVLTA